MLIHLYPWQLQAPPPVIQDEKLVAKLTVSEEKLSLLEKEKLRIQKVCGVHRDRVGGGRGTRSKHSIHSIVHIKGVI